VVAFRLVIEQLDVVIIDAGPFDDNPIRAVVSDLVAPNEGIEERPRA